MVWIVLAWFALNLVLGVGSAAVAHARSEDPYQKVAAILLAAFYTVVYGALSAIVYNL